MTQIARLAYLQNIETKAEEWKRDGYKVKANLNGWDRPSKIEGLVPDLRGKRGDKILIGNVETEDGLKINRERWETFKGYAEKNDNVSFRLFLISENGKCKLHKIYE
jgi:hypothetical protein